MNITKWILILIINNFCKSGFKLVQSHQFGFVFGRILDGIWYPNFRFGEVSGMDDFFFINPTSTLFWIMILLRNHSICSLSGVPLFIPWFLKSFSPWKLPAPPHPQTFSDIPKYNISDLCTQSHIKYFPFKVDACSHQPPISGGEQTGEGSRCAIWRVTWPCGYHWGWFDTSELTWINHQFMGYSWGHHWCIYIYIYGDIWWSFFLSGY